jgi:hypothetical protein
MKAGFVLFLKVMPKSLKTVRKPAPPPFPPVGSMPVAPPGPLGPTQPSVPDSKSTLVVFADAEPTVMASRAMDVLRVLMPMTMPRFGPGDGGLQDSINLSEPRRNSRSERESKTAAPGPMTVWLPPETNDPATWQLATGVLVPIPTSPLGATTRSLESG